MRIAYEGQSFEAVDWGLGGCRISDVAGALPALGTDHTLLCTLPFQGFNITLKVAATVVRLSEDARSVAFKFGQLGEREAALMQHFIEDLVRGKMTTVADTIVRIDTPVTPVPVKPDPNPVQTIPVKRWPIKQIVMTLFYAVLGVVVFGYVGIYLYATLFRLEVQTAVVAAERINVPAPVSAKVIEAPHRNGDTIVAGQVLAVLEDTSHEAELTRARSTLAAVKGELVESEALFGEEKRRSEGYALVARNNVRQAESQITGLELARKNAALKLERLQALFDKGLVVAAEVEEASLALETIVSDLERKQIHIKELNELIDGGESVRLFTGAAFAGQVGQVEARIARLRSDLDFATQEVDRLEQKDTRLLILAQYHGKVIETRLVPGAAVKQGDPLFIVEETGAERVNAFLTQDEVQQIRVGSQADLYIGTENRWISATVSSIDRTAGFVDEITETHRFRAPGARSAMVTLAMDADDLPPSGTPLTVYFERHSNNVVWRRIEQMLQAF